MVGVLAGMYNMCPLHRDVCVGLVYVCIHICVHAVHVGGWMGVWCERSGILSGADTLKTPNCFFFFFGYIFILHLTLRDGLLPRSRGRGMC